MDQTFYLTENGAQKLKQHLQELVIHKEKLLEDLTFQREAGDLAENAEYHSVLQELDRTEVEITETEYILNHASAITTSSEATYVEFGSIVILQHDNGQKRQFQIVSTYEADPLNGMISDESPFGKALLGKALGDKVDIGHSRTITSYVIIKIHS